MSAGTGGAGVAGVGVVELLAVLAVGELTGFERLAADAALAPTLGDKAALATLATAEFRHFERLRDRLVDLGVDPEAAMAPFVGALEAFHAYTAPNDWLEGLVKAYVGDGIAADFYREIASYVDPATRELVVEVCSDIGYADFAVDRVRAAIVADPRVGGRLALWGRRLVGEAIAQAQRVAAEHDGLTALLIGDADRPGADLSELGRMFDRLTEAHAQRMQRLGLAF
jgi:hypothetical protein